MRLKTPIALCESDLDMFEDQPGRTDKRKARVSTIDVEKPAAHHKQEGVCKANYVTPVIF
ncbi:hypothetical protein TI10_01810 [Photorhabdus luminescens subsp. luminescens]|uniref:Uncharacterized protein n=1 Tax=Photorhabdus luminescens TaxID=29488 RepID=A0A1G5PNZ3_PHOLU|nr:hypothetical protein [Photorhabdus luminescens]KMW74543.1 hypothetical protein TI10_01810 [Photorhabdus luminescens subsp. luminescens]SCZ51157.1 hypothetical protein SAMN02982990_00053 [Photorhabdus luminescens]